MPTLASIYSQSKGVTSAELLTLTHTTASIANLSFATYDFTISRLSEFKSITSDRAAKVRLYSTAAGRSSDTRSYNDNSNPPEADLLLDVDFTGAEKIKGNTIRLINQDSPMTASIYAKIWNLSGAPGAVKIDLEVISFSQLMEISLSSVLSVNGSTGNVTLDADDISDVGTTHKFVGAADLNKLNSLPEDTAAAIASKQDALVSGTNIKTINSISLLGEGDIVIESGSSGSNGHIIQSEGIALEARSALNFTGSALVLTDDSVNDRTTIAINLPSSPVTSVNALTGDVVLNADSIDDSTTSHKFATQEQLTLIDTNASDITLLESGINSLSSSLTLLESDIDAKQDALISGTTIKTINSESLLGSGDLVIETSLAGHIIKDATSTFPSRTNLTFTGSVVSVTDDGINDTTLVAFDVDGPPVTSVNSLVGDVVITPDTLDDTSTTHKFVDQALITQVSTNTNDIDLIDSSLTALASEVNDLASYLSSKVPYSEESTTSASYTLDLTADKAQIKRINSAATITIPNTITTADKGWFCYIRIESGGSFTLSPSASVVLDSKGYGLNQTTEGTLWRLENPSGTNGGWHLWLDSMPADLLNITRYNKESLSSTKTLAIADPYYQLLNPNGAARTVVLNMHPRGEVINDSDGTYGLDIKETDQGNVILTLNNVTGYKAINYVRLNDNTFYIKILGGYS